MIYLHYGILFSNNQSKLHHFKNFEESQEHLLSEGQLPKVTPHMSLLIHISKDIQAESNRPASNKVEMAEVELGNLDHIEVQKAVFVQVEHSVHQVLHTEWRTTPPVLYQCEFPA